MAQEYTQHDWPEDTSHENGNYHNVCIHCNAVFTGYKRRVVCKKCHVNTVPVAAAKPYPDEHHD